jgi:thiol-disulfide isomerase/thioredoxin
MKKQILSCVLLLLVAAAVRAQSIPFWKLEQLKAAIANVKKPTIFNFWATFCQPCVQEIPYFQRTVRSYDSAGVQLVLVSLDLPETYPQKIMAFARKHGFTAPIRYLDETNADLFCPAVDTSWSGAIPASLFINPKNGYRKFYEARLEPAQLNQAIRDMLTY